MRVKYYDSRFYNNTPNQHDGGLNRNELLENNQKTGKLKQLKVFYLKH